MADAPSKPKKPKPELSKWATAKRTVDPLIERRARLWEGINAFVTENNGWIVSPKHSPDIRIEAPEHSPLPGKLTELGYRPLAIGQATRLTNKPGAPSPWTVIDVIAISLPR